MSFLHILAAVFAVLLIVVALWDVFETVVLPRRIPRRFRLTRIYFRSTWTAWSSLATRIRLSARRENVLAMYGPLALLLLLVTWAALLIVGFGLLEWGLGSPLAADGRPVTFGTDLYFSGTTLLTLGLGDVVPMTGAAEVLAVVEVGTGFMLLALVIGYVPVLYQAFSRREVRISLLDAHAGSPPTAGALLLRHPPNRRARRLIVTLSEWERWSAELLESHLSYPVLAYYRSQHEEQSWVAALTMIMDVCALVLACENLSTLDEDLTEQAAYTFAIARHAAADLAQVFFIAPAKLDLVERLPPADRRHLHDALLQMGLTGDISNVQVELDALRRLYESHVAGLAHYLLLELPPWMPQQDALDDWQTSADGLTAPPIKALSSRNA